MAQNLRVTRDRRRHNNNRAVPLVVLRRTRKTKGKEKDARCPSRSCARSGKTGKWNCIRETFIDFIMRGYRGEKEGELLRRTQEELRGRDGGRLSSFDTICSGASRYAAVFFKAASLGKFDSLVTDCIANLLACFKANSVFLNWS